MALIDCVLLTVINIGFCLTLPKLLSVVSAIITKPKVVSQPKLKIHTAQS